MKIILINPPWKNSNVVPSLGLAYLSAVLKHNGFEVALIDANAKNARYSYKDIFKQVKTYNPDLIGITICTNFAKNGYLVMNSLLSLNKVIIVGGPHPSAVPYEPFGHGADIVVKGEGEKTIVELVKTLRDRGNLREVKGIVFKDKNGNIVENPSQNLIENLDDLPYPDKDLFDLRLYVKRGGVSFYGAILTSRGCSGQCTFCSKSVFGNRYRFRSPKNIYDEIVYLIKKYGINEFVFVDDAFTVNKKMVEELCDLIIKNKLDIKWHCSSRVNAVTKEMLIKMKKAGCRLVMFGIEHGDDESLRKIKKYITMEQVEKVCGWTKELNIKATTGFIFGFPWDTVETVRRTFNAAREFGRDGGINASYLSPYPGTEIYEKYKKEHDFLEWWLKREGIDPYELKEIALGKKLSLPNIKLPDDVRKEIEQALRNIHSKFASEKKYQIYWWFFQFRKLMYRISPKLEKKISGQILRIYSQHRNKMSS